MKEEMKVKQSTEELSERDVKYLSHTAEQLRLNFSKEKKKTKKTPGLEPEKWALIFIEDFYKTEKSSLKQMLMIH